MSRRSGGLRLIRWRGRSSDEELFMRSMRRRCPYSWSGTRCTVATPRRCVDVRDRLADVPRAPARILFHAPRSRVGGSLRTGLLLQREVISPRRLVPGIAIIDVFGGFQFQLVVQQRCARYRLGAVARRWHMLRRHRRTIIGGILSGPEIQALDHLQPGGPAMFLRMRIFIGGFKIGLDSFQYNRFDEPSARRE